MTSLIDILSIAMVPVALAIVAVGAIHRMIQFYRVQCLILASLTLLTALNPEEQDFTTRALLVAFAFLIPGLLAYIIEPLLAQATVPVPAGGTVRLRHSFLRLFSPNYAEETRNAVERALPVWLEHGLAPSRQIGSVIVSLGLTALAYTAAISLPGKTSNPEIAVSLILLLLGIFTMINRRDLISQVMGLLVMDHGLFLAAVRVIEPTLIPIFVISLFLYILITLVILVLLLPELHSASGTIEVSEQNQLQG